MAALVQSYPQHAGTVTMQQTRPSSTSGLMPAGSPQANQQYMGSAQTQRHSFHAMGGPAIYRAGSGPIQPYAFTTTPSLNTQQWQQFSGFRTSSSPTVPTMQTFDQSGGSGSGRGRHAPNASMTNFSSYNPSMGLSKSGSRDDSSIRQPRVVSTTPRPQSAHMGGTSTQVSFTHAAPVRASPDRYRRPALQQQRPQNSAPPSGSGMSSVSHLYNSSGANEPRRNLSPSLSSRPNSYYGSTTGAAADDMQLNRQAPQEESRRLRRRSMHTLDSADYPNPLTPQVFSPPGESSRVEPVASKIFDKEPKSIRLVPCASPAEKAAHARNDSSESLASTRSSSSRPSSVSL